MRTSLVAVLCAVALACSSPNDPVSPCTGSQTFDFTGALQTFTVPTCAVAVTILAQGAQGGAATTDVGGKGASIQGYVQVTPGDVLTILVGGAGAAATNT